MNSRRFISWSHFILQVALKLIEKKSLLPEDLSKIHREIAIAQALRHPHVIRTYQTVENGDHIAVGKQYKMPRAIYLRIFMRASHFSRIFSFLCCRVLVSLLSCSCFFAVVFLFLCCRVLVSLLSCSRIFAVVFLFLCRRVFSFHNILPIYRWSSARGPCRWYGRSLWRSFDQFSLIYFC